MPAVYWLIAAVIFLLIEIVTTALASIWFTGGALAGALTAFLGGPVWAQFAAFAGVSILMLVTIAPLARRSMIRRKQATNIDSLIGRTGLVTQGINNLKAVGQVSLDGQIWTARSTIDDVLLEEGRKVRVVRIDGVKLIVVPEQEG